MPEAERRVGDATETQEPSDLAGAPRDASSEVDAPDSPVEPPAADRAPASVEGAPDEWDAPADEPEPADAGVESLAPAAPEAIEAPADEVPRDAYATGVLEIVTSLDTGKAGATAEAAAAVDAPAEVAAGVEAPADAAAGVEVPVEAAPEGTTLGVEPVAGEAIVAEESADQSASGELEAEQAAAGDGAAGASVPAEPGVPVGAEEGLAVVTDLAAETAPEPELRAHVPWWPFVAYLSLWVIGLGSAAYLLLQVPAGRPLYEEQLYGYVVIGGLALTVLGPLMIPFVWLLARSGVPKPQRGGLFARTAFWCSVSTLFGVALWWGTLLALDAARFGSPL